MSINERYIRNLNALSVEECKRLHDKHVCIVGCGGLGGYVISDLARIGVGGLTIIDCDAFDVSNLNRQVFATQNSLGKPKVDTIVKELANINNEVCVNPINERITKDNASLLIKGYDCVIDCLDNFEARFWLAHACETNNIPIIYGAIAGWYGQVCTIFPGDVTFVDIYGSMEDGTHIKDDQGNLSFTAGIVGNIQSAECVKVLLDKKDVLRNKILMIDMSTSTFETMEVK